MGFILDLDCPYEKTIETFKRMTLPLFGFYIIFVITTILIAAISVVAAVMPILRSGEFSSSFPSDPSIPVPPDNGSMTNFGYGSFGELTPYFEELEPYMDMAPMLLLGIALLIVLGLLMSSIFQVGIFHLTKKPMLKRPNFGISGFRALLASLVGMSFSRLYRLL